MCGGEPPTDGDSDGSVTAWFLCSCCSKITSRWSPAASRQKRTHSGRCENQFTRRHRRGHDAVVALFVRIESRRAPKLRAGRGSWAVM